MKKYRGQILKQVGNVTYVCFNPKVESHVTEGSTNIESSFALVEE